MKLVVFALSALLVGFSASAQTICIDGDPCYASTQGEVDAQVYFRDQHNAQLCDSVGLSESCTQAEFDAAGGSGTIYTSNASGTRNFFLDKIVEHLQRQVASYESEYRGRANNRWTDSGQSAAPVAFCTTVGLSSGCTRREVACKVLEGDELCAAQ